MTVFGKIENNKLICVSNNLGITGLADSPSLCEANGFTAYTEEQVSGYFVGTYQIIDGVLINITNTDEYKNKVKKEKKKTIQDKYKNIMDEYVCAKVKQDLFTTAEYQSMITDMYAETGAL